MCFTELGNYTDGEHALDLCSRKDIALNYFVCLNMRVRQGDEAKGAFEI